MPKKLKWLQHSDLAIRRTPTVGRDEFLDCMTFRSNEGPLFTELFGPIVGLKEEWEEQGATPAELDFSAFRYRCESRHHVPANCGRNDGYPEVTIKETDEYRLYRDGLGRTMKLPKGVATLAMPLDFPVKNMDDWLKIRPWYRFSEDRFAPGWDTEARARLAAGDVISVVIPGGFDEPRQLLGEEGLCLAYYDQPELIHDILNTITDTAVRVLDRVSAAVTVDALVVHDDMAGKSGSLAGPKQITQFIKPYYRRVWDMLADRGTRIFSQDSDGNLNGVIDALLDTGINLMVPMEPAAGMDIVALRAKYGKLLALGGGIDKHVIRQSQDAIDRELERKLPPMIRSGACILSLDHRIPNGTPLANYKYYIRKAWEILEREACRLPTDSHA